MLLTWIVAVAGMWRIGHPVWDDILTVGFAHLLAGRAISIAQGTQVGLPQWLIVLVATWADVTFMLIVFPLFVYSYEHLFEGRFIQKRMRRVLESARRNVGRFGRYKVAGVFLFVWLPFWMTGIIAGAVLGYLLGLRNWVTVVTVSVAALAAVWSWVYAYDRVFAWLAGFHQEIPLVFTVALIVALIAVRIVRRRRLAARAEAAGRN